MMIGVDYHPSFQQVAFLIEETGEYGDRRLNHSDGDAEKFYRDLKLRGVHVRVRMEATGYSRWFERLLAELGFGSCTPRFPKRDSAFTHVTACMLAESPMRPSTPKASAASLPPLLLRLLPVERTISRAGFLSR